MEPKSVAAPPKDSNLTRSLHVRNLHPDVTEEELLDLFKKSAPVSSVKVVRSGTTNKSLGYAYINFNTALDEDGAKKALSELMYRELHGLPLRLQVLDPDAKRKERTPEREGNVFVKGLSPEVDHWMLHSTFSVFGEVLCVKINRPETGKNLGFGFVQFKDCASAQRAIDMGSGTILRGELIHVEKYVARKDRESSEFAKEWGFTNVYVKGLPDCIKSDYDLKGLFEKFGEITSVHFPKDEFGEPQRFGFINFLSNKSAAKAVESMNGQEVDGKMIFVGEAQTKEQRRRVLAERFAEKKKEQQAASKEKNVYVKNLHANVTDRGLGEMFAPHGKITSAKVMLDNHGESLCFGFVCFEQGEQANEAILAMNGMEHGARRLYVCLAQGKDERQAMLERSHAVEKARIEPLKFPPHVVPSCVIRAEKLKEQQQNQQKAGGYTTGGEPGKDPQADTPTQHKVEASPSKPTTITHHYKLPVPDQPLFPLSSPSLQTSPQTQPSYSVQQINPPQPPPPPATPSFQLPKDNRSWVKNDKKDGNDWMDNSGGVIQSVQQSVERGCLRRSKVDADWGIQESGGGWRIWFPAEPPGFETLAVIACPLLVAQLGYSFAFPEKPPGFECPVQLQVQVEVQASSQSDMEDQSKDRSKDHLDPPYIEEKLVETTVHENSPTVVTKPPPAQTMNNRGVNDKENLNIVKSTVDERDSRNGDAGEGSLATDLLELVIKEQPDLLLAKKLTGMIMMLDKREVRKAVMNAGVLKEKIQSALFVLEDFHGGLDGFCVRK